MIINKNAYSVTWYERCKNDVRRQKWQIPQAFPWDVFGGI